MVFDSTHVAVEWLRAGKPLVYPTESVWGLGCDAFNEQAVERLLTLKNRPIEKGLIVITANADLIQPFLKTLPNTRRDEILTSWANPRGQATTWLFSLPADLPQAIPAWITGDFDTLAIRIISHPTIQTLCQSLISPTNPYGFIVSTSCNISGEPPAKTLSQAQAQFDKVKDVGFLAGETLGFTLPSQIKDTQTGQTVRF